MSGSSASQPESSAPVSQTAHKSRFVLVALAAAIIWYAGLISLILFTERPVTVNRRQIIESHVVVTGSVDAQGNVTVLQILKGRENLTEFQIKHPRPMQPGDWLLPLRRLGDGFEVTPTRLPNKTRLVYPVADDVIADVQNLVSAG